MKSLARRIVEQARSRSTKSIGRRITIFIILVSTSITLIISGILLTIDVIESRREIDRSLDKLSLAIPRISSVVWELDYDKITMALDELQRQPNIEQVKVTSRNSVTEWRAGQVRATSIVTRRFELERGDLNKGRTFGQLEVVASLDGLYGAALSRAVEILVTTGLTTLGLALSLFVYLRRVVTRRLEALAEKVRILSSPEFIGAPIGTDWHELVPEGIDELAMVEWTVDRTAGELSKSEAALRGSEARSRSLAEVTADGYWEQDVDLRYTLFEGSRPETIDKLAGVTTFGLHRWDLPTVVPGVVDWETHKSVLAARQTFRGLEQLLYDGQGKMCWLSLSGEPIYTSQGIFAGYRGTVRDITDRKESELMISDLNRKLQSLLDAALQFSIVSTDPYGSITVFNRGAELMLGYASDEMIGKSPIIFHQMDEIQARAKVLGIVLERPIDGFETLVALARQGIADSNQWSFVRKDGSIVRVAQSVSAVTDDSGKVTGYLGISRDITEQLAAEANLLKLNLELDHRVKERTEELQKTLDDLHSAQDRLIQSEKLVALGSIVAAVAHELNTPIGISLTVGTTIDDRTDSLVETMTTGGLRKKHLDEYIADVREGLTILLKNLHRTAKLVDNFKQIAVVQSGLDRGTFNLREVVEHVVAMLAADLSPTPFVVELDIPQDLSMYSYPASFEQIFKRLLDNSLVHGLAGRRHGLIRLQASVEIAGAGEMVRIVFSDDGAGMTEEVRRRIFEPFFTTQLGKGGSGLGMSVCHNLIVGPLGGNITVTSAPGEGSIFTMHLPRSSPLRDT